MDREFLDLYNRELRVFTEQAREFAEEFPGIADRLGGLMSDQTDPMISGLLEGAAFLAARIQLKIKHEFPEFTHNYIEQLVPNYLAPTPSVLLASIQPPYGDPGLRDGITIPRDLYLDAIYKERDAPVGCRFRLTSSVTLWPFAVAAAEYLPNIGAIHAAGVSPPSQTVSGLRLTLQHRTLARVEDEPTTTTPDKRLDVHFAGCRTDSLTFHIAGNEADAVALYEQLFTHCRGIYFRYLDAFGDPIVLPCPIDCLHQISFDEEDALLPKDDRIFQGFDMLREYFMFPRKFLGFRLSGLKRIFANLPTHRVEIFMAFDELNMRLSAAVRADMFSLYCVPAVNLFETATDRVALPANQHEFQVVPDRTRLLDYEVHRVIEVFAHYSGTAKKAPLQPLYSASGKGQLSENELCYTVHRLARRRTTKEKRLGQTSNYAGTDMYVSIVEPAMGLEHTGALELSTRALCSNRHLPEQLPVGQGGADFVFADNSGFQVRCLFGPTAPREPVVAQMRARAEYVHTGAVAWRLINILSLNHLGLSERGAGRNGVALRETLSLFADLADPATERRIRGVKSVDSKPVVRRMRHKHGVGAARGIEITITLDEKAFEGSGCFLLGAILDRFFCEYAAMNHFTQLVVVSTERGQIIRWPVRYGTRRPL